jgi:HEPN domain-containing protein
MSKPIIELKQKNRTFNSTWLKTYEGFEDYTEEDAEKIVEQLQKLANIVCDHVQKTST